MSPRNIDPAQMTADNVVPPQQSYAIDPREIFRILRRHIKMILLVPVLLVLVSLAFIAVVTPLYTAKSTIFIDPRHSTIGDPDSQILSSFGSDDSTIESQVLLIQSLAVLQRVVDRLKLSDDPEFVPPPGVLGRIKSLFSSGTPPANGQDPARATAVETLQRRTKVLRQRTTFLVDIDVSSRDPAKAATIANAIADSYFTEQVQSKFDTAKIATGWLGQQIEQLKGKVITSDNAVQEFRKANNLVASQGVTVNDQQITDLNTRLVEARVQTAEMLAKYNQVQQIAKNGGDPGSVSEALSSEVIARLRAQYADLAKNEADLSSRYGARHPLVTAVRAQLHDTQSLINAELKRILQGLRHNYDVAAAREASLQKSFDSLQGVSMESNQAQVRLRELQREADANRTLYESFLARYKQTSAQESLKMPESRVIARAEAPLRPSFPRVTLTLGLAVVLGLGLGCVIAMIADYLDRRIKSLDQARTISGLPSLATIPAVGLRELAHLAKRGRTELENYDAKTARVLPPSLQPALLRYALEEPMSPFAEGIRAIRLAIQRSARSRPAQVIMVTSALESEGKTTLAANLAMSLAAIGTRTILVEGDLRNAELTRSLCPRARFGLIEAATGEIPILQAITVEPSTGLAVLPAPRQEDGAVTSEFVPSNGMAAVLAELRRHFDTIVIDAPPLLPLVDGRALAELADCVLLAVGWDRTPQDALARAMDLLSPVHDRILGTVLTRVDLGRLRFYDMYSTAYYTPAYGVPDIRGAA